MQGITQNIFLPDGREVVMETGKLAKQADGAVVVRMGNTMLLATVVSTKEAKEDTDFLPLTVEYQEKYAATGRFPGGFFKREARPSEYEILTARLVDRALRPLFPDDYHAETQVLITLISGDKNFIPDCLAGLAASAALSVSDIPFNGPISEVKVARVDGKFIVNPVVNDLERSDMDLMVAATLDNIVMVEGEMKEISENELLQALEYAHEVIKVQCLAQIELSKKVGACQNKRQYNHEVNDEELKQRVHDFCYDKIYDLASHPTNKHERTEKFEQILNDFIETIPVEERTGKELMVKRYYYRTQWEAVRNVILERRVRLDGRQLDEIRPIWSEVDYLPTAHGSAIFTRGETQSLTTCTLGTKLDEQTIDGAVLEGKVNFILHYNFPPFSTGEVRTTRGTSRREIGHGNLALRALKPVMPLPEENPYTIRVVSDILESNGSSSMATVCAGTLALMDAGVKIRKPVSGIAMGLITDEQTGNYAILSDILGDEDHLGDMDFKVAGTEVGITACQMDIKVSGLSAEILNQALVQARKGRLHILREMRKTISSPRPDYKPHVPRIVQMTIPREFIGAVIGPGGKIIQDIQHETNSTIVIEEVGEFGIIDIVAVDRDSIEAVKKKIKSIIAIPEIGEVYTGKVKTIVPFGAFVEILPGKDGLLHISEIDWKRINDIESVLKVGDEVTVKLIDIDRTTGKLKLSRKALLPKPGNNNTKQ
ncbi:MAG TPA: polyribonucleotide nucleotidyltransferase [Bacteroidales bacterium]|jgi:polyribonucleotide nucleotidyltransferase|nr:polyribonucleotide nucleotidyltransferase [Bacteroidales bacterium]MDI9574058.1 polyribonucleotide nucleotidyltransferase [Bacteroidota bacterium]OQC59188.1 MAG: Polyribonucleotide nucleotidyltransferase [Bacteroidetes bacterium ADurb.Bin012]MBP9511586.1 polyribonucleotide nucleotidyltransferase [Bacteroidales bacterium]MBP9588768.1 polyribonucleotide nucleotidyltransferase [Bacteroidales bacterium]